MLSKFKYLIIRYKLYLLPVLLPAFCSCAKEDCASSWEGDGSILFVYAASLPFDAEAGPSTKAVNDGFLTSFEPGDCIGVTGVDKNGNVVDQCNNVRFTFQRDTVQGGEIWASFLNDLGYPFVENFNGVRYFAYYPYDSKWNGKTMEDILSGFVVSEDQHTKELFTSSDLMLPQETIVPENGQLRFVLKHQMATVSLFYNNEFRPDGVVDENKLQLYTGTIPSSLTLEHTYRAELEDGSLDHRHRYLVDPTKCSEIKLTGALQEDNIRFFSYSHSVERGHLYSFSFEGEPMVSYADGVNLGLDDVPFVDRNGDTTILGYSVFWSKYNLGESLSETYPFEPAAGDRGTRKGSRDPKARGDYYSWGATYTQYDNGLTGYKGYGYNTYFDNEFKITPLGGTIKETEYDVAHAKWWRGKWRLPTENEFRAMYEGCDFTLEEVYAETQQRYMGTPGTRRSFNVIKVTSKQDPTKFIYLSTGGYLDGTMEAERDAEGNYTPSGDGKFNQGIVSPSVAYYMSSSASPTILRCVSYAYISLDQRIIKVDGSRYTGMLVRPVYSPNEPK